MIRPSGFCNSSNPLDSHRRCRLEGCPCVCHRIDAEPRETPGALDPVAGAAAAVDALTDALPDLMAASTDTQALDLALLLVNVRETRVALQGVERDLEHTTGRQMLADFAEGDGVRVERSRARERTEWDHEQWRHDVRANVLRKHGAMKGAQLLTAEGELVPVSLSALLAEVQAVHGASAPLAKGMSQLGLDRADYCTTSPGAVRVSVTRLADETKTEETTA